MSQIVRKTRKHKKAAAKKANFLNQVAQAGQGPIGPAGFVSQGYLGVQEFTERDLKLMQHLTKDRPKTEKDLNIKKIGHPRFQFEDLLNFLNFPEVRKLKLDVMDDMKCVMDEDQNIEAITFPDGSFVFQLFKGDFLIEVKEVGESRAWALMDIVMKLMNSAKKNQDEIKADEQKAEAQKLGELISNAGVGGGLLPRLGVDYFDENDATKGCPLCIKWYNNKETEKPCPHHQFVKLDLQLQPPITETKYQGPIIKQTDADGNEIKVNDDGTFDIQTRHKSMRECRIDAISKELFYEEESKRSFI